MKKIYFFLLIVSTGTYAQSPDDALRSMWLNPSGTARNKATGGVMGSLGGDITANHVNPAGLGLFKTREFVLTPGFLLNNAKFNYRGTDTTNKKNALAFGTSGWVWGSGKSHGSKWTSSAFALTVNQLASFNYNVQFKGFNNQSSFTEQYLEELTRDRADTLAALDRYVFGSSLAFRTFLIDTLQGTGGSFIGYKSQVPISTGVNQTYDLRSTGSAQEIALGAAGNLEDKLYVGGSLTIPIIHQRRELVYREEDATSNPNNNFAFFEYRENFVSNGIGIGGKLGMIYKPKEYFRIGLALHTPQFISYKDQVRASLTANTENYAGSRTESSDRLRNNDAGLKEYSVISPWKLIASASYVFREVSDTRKQRAFLSADIEYINYRAIRFHAADASDLALTNYYTQLNSTIKNFYKGNLNFRMGGEVKFNTIMIRAGAAYIGSPYADDALKVNNVLLSGGLGYRDKGIFIDLTYVHNINQGTQFPYRLNDKANTFAVQSGNLGNIVATFGIKF